MIRGFIIIKAKMNKSDIRVKAWKITLWLQNGYMLFMYAPNLSFGGVLKSMLTLNEAIIDVKEG